jgi:dCTP diphosphatase
MKDIELKVKKYLESRGWDKALPGDMAKSISIEAAELLEHFQWRNPSSIELKKDKEKMEDIKKELADILIYCIDLAVLLNIDTKKIILSKLAYNQKKFPVKKVKGNSANYFNIKKEYRKKGF